MIVEIELGILVLIGIAHLAALFGRALAAADIRITQEEAEPAKPTLDATPHAPATHAIVKRSAGVWHFVGHRHAEHPDLHEALATPGLAVRHPDGHIEEGFSA